MWNYHGAWLQAWKMIMNGELFGQSVATADPQGLFHTLIKNRQAVQQVVTGRTPNGDGTLTLTFADATYDSFRTSDKVVDFTAMSEGYIMTRGAGTITIAPLNNPAAFGAAHFALNSTVTAYGKLAGLYNSVGTTTIYESKDRQEDYLEITRESHQVAQMEKTHRFAATVGGEEKVYGYTEGEADMVGRAIFYSVFKKFFGQGGTGMTGLEGQMNKTYGIRNRLIDDSGNYLLGGAPITLANIEQIAGTCADSNPGFEQDIIALPGRNALRELGRLFPTQLGFSGGQREGKVLSISLDVREIIISGITVKVATNFNMLNDIVNLPEWMKDSIYFINKAQTVVGGQQRSLVHPIHFSQSAGSDYRPIYRCIPGMVGIGAGDSTGLPSQEGYQLAGSSVHGASCEFLDNSGISMVPYGHGLFEYQY